jgi:hypothetical protein
MAEVVKSMFGDMFKSPEQIRQEQQDKLLEQGRMSAGMLLQNNSNSPTSGLANAIRGYGAGILQNIPRDADRLKRGMLGAAGEVAGLAGNEQGKQAFREAAMSPEERQAMESQRIAQSASKEANAQNLSKAIQYFESIGNYKAAEVYKGKLEKLQTSEALSGDFDVNSPAKSLLDIADKLETTQPKQALNLRLKAAEYAKKDPAKNILTIEERDGNTYQVLRDGRTGDEVSSWLNESASTSDVTKNPFNAYTPDGKPLRLATGAGNKLVNITSGEPVPYEGEYTLDKPTGTGANELSNWTFANVKREDGKTDRVRIATTPSGSLYEAGTDGQAAKPLSGELVSVDAATLAADRLQVAGVFTKEAGKYDTGLEQLAKARAIAETGSPMAGAQVKRFLATLAGDKQLSMAEVQSLAVGTLGQRFADSIGMFLNGQASDLTKEQQMQIIDAVEATTKSAKTNTIRRLRNTYKVAIEASGEDAAYVDEMYKNVVGSALSDNAKKYLD